MPVPARIEWAVQLLELGPTDRALEIGCGPGVAAALVAGRLTGGCLVAIDRSATAIARAATRNAGHVASGRLVLEQVSLADFRTEQRFDKAFGVNVNVFWTTDGAAECATLRDVLVPGGAVHLVYGGPGDGRPDAVARVVDNLGRHGFDPVVRRGPEPGLVSVSASLPADRPASYSAGSW